MGYIDIELVDVAGGDKSVVNSARVSFNRQVDEVSEKDSGLINYLAEHKHMTPFRHNFIQLRCRAPIFLVRQLGKHQAGLSWNEMSRRYVKTEPEFYVPDKWRAAPTNGIKQGSGEDIADQNYYGEYYARVIEYCKACYEDMLSDGVAPEMARMVLPQSMMTEWIWSGNLLAFAHVYKERIAPGAQKEARMFAEKLDEVIRPEFPLAWSALVDDHETH